jgi:hypothetical protein
MLRSVQRLERRGGFRPRLYTTRREYLEYVELVRIQGAERETWGQGKTKSHGLDRERQGRSWVSSPRAR